MRISRLAIVVALLAIAPASATDTTSKLPPSRYIFSRVADGFMRLDNQTGQVAHCNQREGAWICQVVPERRAALEEEIVRLQSKIASLQKEIARLRAQPAAPPSPKPVPDDSNARAEGADSRQSAGARQYRARPRIHRQYLASADGHAGQPAKGCDTQGLAPRVFA